MSAAAMRTILSELLAVSGKRSYIEELEISNPEKIDIREQKKNYAEELSRLLAQNFSDHLRPYFNGILPDEHGKGQESLARASKRPKKLDVNYSNPQIGLGLGVSIKTLNFRDIKSRRYTKNYTRVDNEWRAEASDYHERQPYAVLIGILFLPSDSTEDKINTHSSFAQAVNVFRHRSGRTGPKDREELFERVYVALYHPNGDRMGEVRFFDVGNAPPQDGFPAATLEFDDLIRRICSEYDDRNKVSMPWEDSVTEEPPTIEQVEELQEEQDDGEEIF